MLTMRYTGMKHPVTPDNLHDVFARGEGVLLRNGCGDEYTVYGDGIRPLHSLIRRQARYDAAARVSYLLACNCISPARDLQAQWAGEGRVIRAVLGMQ